VSARYRTTPTGRWGTRDVVELTAEQAREVLAAVAAAQTYNKEESE
jgi:hypothetical protein